MDSKDIYRKIGQMMLKDGYMNRTMIKYRNKEEKKEVIISMDKALLEYTCQKIYGQGMKEDIVMDLGFLFDTMDNYLFAYDKEEFYRHYVHCMLNIYNTIENKNIMWSPELPTTQENYPRFEKEGVYLEFFKTDINASNKDIAIWLHDQLLEKYNCKTNRK